MTPTKTSGKVAAAKEELTVYLPDTRGVTVSRWGKGNTKLGPDVYTYSRLPGRLGGTCPGATPRCQDICYAMRVNKTPVVWDLWTRNSQIEDVPEELPPGARLVRIHVSGDFTSLVYITAWIQLIARHPRVSFWAYTRSWRVPELLSRLEQMRALRNVQLFASVDTDSDLPPDGWRIAWLEDDPRAVEEEVCSLPCLEPHEEADESGTIARRIKETGQHNFAAVGGRRVYVCPEETGRKPSCQACQYCIRGRSGDVVFLLH